MAHPLTPWKVLGCSAHVAPSGLQDAQLRTRAKPEFRPHSWQLISCWPMVSVQPRLVSGSGGKRDRK